MIEEKDVPELQDDMVNEVIPDDVAASDVDPWAASARTFVARMVEHVVIEEEEGGVVDVTVASVMSPALSPT